ncbi:8608_t:CDS:10 [Entrophospora sp. SA101]|nr:8608_t:CDS:10 [Entrophospora sp. SA101]
MDIDSAYKEDNLPWVEKYRPKTLDELLSHKNIITTIEAYINRDQLPHLLFYGPPGTGKTSTIFAVANKIYGDKWKSMVMELNASDDRGIDVVREQIKNFASTRNIFSSNIKLIILDEADAMTQPAQNALRRSKDQIISCLNDIVEAERINISQDGIEALIKISCGDMRRVLNILQACHATNEFIDEDAICNCTGRPNTKDIELIVKTMTCDDYSTAHSNIQKLKTEKGLALQDILTDFCYNLRKSFITDEELFENIGEIEYRLATGATEKHQLTAFIGSFKKSLKKGPKNNIIDNDSEENQIEKMKNTLTNNNQITTESKLLEVVNDNPENEEKE